MKKIFMLAILAVSTMTGYAADSIKDKEEYIQAAGLDPTVFVCKPNSASNIGFYTSNYGILGFDEEQGIGGTFWPKGSMNAYVFGSGVWFVAQKKVLDTNGNSAYRKMAVISYNPYNATSWLIPGYIDEGDSVRADLKEKNGIYASTAYYKETGISMISDTLPNWCLWKFGSNEEYEFGRSNYENVVNAENRNFTNYPQGPMFVSDEDIVTAYKDTDLSKYKMGAAAAKRAGYPLRLQFEERVMSWSWKKDEKKDALVVFYTIENKSNDTLVNCRIGSMVDPDIARVPYVQDGAKNDRARHVSEYPNLNLTVAWTDIDMGEYGKNFGYIGVSLIETPAVDANGFIRNDKSIYYPEEQVGVSTIKISNIETWEINTDQDIYDTLSTGRITIDDASGDKRLLSACGAFNMRPGDKARFAVAINFALPTKVREADGTIEDLTGFIGNGKMDALCSNSGSLIDNLNKLRTEYYKAITLSMDDETVTNIMLGDVYPNPTTKAINVNYSLPSAGDVSIGIYDQLGNEVQALAKGFKTSGSQSEMFQLNTELFSNGMYYLRVKTTSGTAVKAISIVK